MSSFRLYVTTLREGLFLNLELFAVVFVCLFWGLVVVVVVWVFG